MLRRSLTALLGVCALSVWAQPSAYPNKPIRMVVPYTPGTGPDTIGRFVAERLQPRLGEHSVEVLREAGFTQGEIDAMLKSGATKTA